MESNRSYRIRTKINSDELQPVAKIDLPLTQTYDMFEILSLKLNQKNDYNFYDSEVGLVVGRVLANQGFGIPNAKVSVFIPMSDDATVNQRILYNFVSTQDTNYDNIRYNLLPDFVDNACHQDVGTFPNKRLVLDNNDVIEIFDKYYKYTTVTNEAGDYMIYGVPTGSQTIHVDLDMSDIGVLSQRPRDMVYKGYNINQFESPNKFKTSSNLNSLSQLYSQDKGVFVYSYWGNSNNGTDHIAITRCDINIEYKFEPTCIFIGSIVTDKGSNAIGKNCTGTDNVGKMSDLMAGEGSIEMIRKTIDGKVEECPIKGNRLIDGDGVWCYQIPMNLDYVMTDEYGNIVPTDDPSKGIPTRTRVRFRISLDESPMDATARKRCRFLVPNNPRMDETDFPEFCKIKEADYEFGSMTREESYCDMFWNNVYTVKSYIPRLQKNKNSTNRKHTGIKLINYYGDNNPMPYNSLSIKLSFTYRLICVIMKIVIWLIATINQILALIMEPLCQIGNLFLSIKKGLCKISILGIKPLCWLGAPFGLLGNLFLSMVVKGITLSSDFCDDGINKIAFYPILTKISPCVLNKVKKDYNEKQNSTNPEERARLKVITITSMDNNELITCIENQLAQENDATSFNFQNDWLNGCLYAPLWYRKITPKKSFLFGLFKKKAKDQWCRADRNFNLMVYQPCALKLKMGGSEKVKDIVTGEEKTIKTPNGIESNCGKKCHEEKTTVNVTNGLVLTKENMLGQTLYYYKAINYEQTLANTNDKDGVVLLFATDIVLLGSLNDCDINGIPQFFKYLESTTYNLPTDVLFTDTVIQVDSEGNVVVNGNNDIVYEQFTEATGCDWGNLNSFDECGKMGKDTDSGLFYGIGCSSIELERKSCLNLSRICEYGVSLDEAKEITLLDSINNNPDSEPEEEKLTPDGFVSFDELYNINERSMFATLNGNRLHTRLNKKNGLKEYDLKFLYTDNFDGLMNGLMRRNGSCNYVSNHSLEYFSRDYYLFRMGNKPFYYYKDNNNYSLPRYENSFYFYFGIKAGKTAIEKFNSQFFATCEDASAAESAIKYEAEPNDWCSTDTGYILLDMSNIAKPYSIMINSLTDGSIAIPTVNDVNEDKIYFGNKKAYEKHHNNEDIPNGVKIVEVNLPNGKYEITITDGEGNIITTQINLSKQSLSFTYSKVDNDVPNNQREDENGGNYLNEGYLNNINANYIKYGGYIVIDNIVNGENPKGKYRVTVEALNDLTGFEATCEIRVDEQGNITGYGNANPKYIFKFTDGEFYIIVPKGDVDYVVTINEMIKLANGDECEKNVSKLTIRVADALPFKLFVNDVDVSALKDLNGSNWRIGYENNNPTKNPEISSLGQAWRNLSNASYYDITKLDKYSEVRELEEANASPTEIANKKKEILDEFIASVKETFWLTNTSDPKDIIITVQTNKYPIKYHFHYNEEESSEIQGVNQLTDEYKNDYRFDEDLATSQITDILIPTITNKDNAFYGYGDGKNSNKVIKDSISYGYDRTVGHGIDEKGRHRSDLKFIKKPYGIRIVNKDGDGEKLPIIGNVKTNMDGDGKKQEVYFFFHIIDKVLRFNNMLAWSYVNNIPYPEHNDKSYAGKFINMNGLCTGIIHNGITNADKQFEEFTLGGIENIQVMTTNGEDEIPTIRYLDKIYEYEGNANTYPNYGGRQKYIAVRNRQDTLEINDSGNAYISETVYGNMKISLSKVEDSKITFRLDNGDNTDNNKYYLIEDATAAYPLKNVLLSGNLWKYKNGIDYGIMSYNIPIETLYERATNALKGYTPTDEKPDTIDGKAYSTNGVFTFNKDDRKFYVIAVTSNNCRTISPLYDYKEITVQPILAELNTIVDNGDGTYGNTIDYKMGIKVNNGNYYVDYYQSNIALLFKLSEQLFIDEEAELSPTTGDKIAYFNIDSTIYEQLKTYFSSSFFFKMIKKKFNITVTDITNLPLKTKLEDGKKETRYAVIWQLNDAEMSDDFEENNDLTYYLQEGDTIPNIFNNGVTANNKNGYHYNGLIKLPSNTSFKDGDTMPSESIIITTSYTPTKFIFKVGAHGTWDGLSDKTDREGTATINGDTISVSIDTVKPLDGWKFTGWSYNGQIYNTSPIIFNEPIYLEKVELVAQYESV